MIASCDSSKQTESVLQYIHILPTSTQWRHDKKQKSLVKYNKNFIKAIPRDGMQTKYKQNYTRTILTVPSNVIHWTFFEIHI